MKTITGTVTTIDGQPNLVIPRVFGTTAARLWRELTESARLERWIGRWEGDPASGHVTFFMTAEGGDAPPEEYTILECDPPRRFAGDASQAAGAWHLWFELGRGEGTTTLTFGQRLEPGDDLASIGPGWEYYLDRLVAVQEGGDAASVEWDDYYPALSDAYAALAP